MESPVKQYGVYLTTAGGMVVAFNCFIKQHAVLQLRKLPEGSPAREDLMAMHMLNPSHAKYAAMWGRRFATRGVLALVAPVAYVAWHMGKLKERQ
ncbi:hypothetical protein TSOC_001054 [Tetrabaena socialis]|uniref:Uncharacterized protein n=1 Tax=Tetrabaena socialis TaxID=47790 RepID=A0A2J8AHQ7_9CHLO|nr:hypothetical protein TSOC_001054 [Tetrabaena socialis]|eukprot:PNH12037.1 hypothetical protein TSOC_001054 [Tetrabaena socialis]